MIKKSYRVGIKKRDWAKIWRVSSIVLVAIILVSTVVIKITYDKNLRPVSASQRGILINIPEGSSAHEIAVELQQKGVIRSSWAFEWFVRNASARDRLQAGSYNLHPDQSVSEIVDILTQGRVATDLLTILPAQRLDQIRSALINTAGFGTKDVDAALNPDLYVNSPALADKPADANLEGYLYPDSFQKTSATKAADIIRASLGEMQKHLTPDIRDAIVHQGLTVHQGIILASIIEQEVSKPADKTIVAQVFLSRLRQGLPLQSDVTVIYGALKDGKQPNLSYDSDYNTFTHIGLPPGPISNVNQSSLDAVAHPANTDFLYFVAGDDGTTYFAHTLAEHLQNVKDHCKKLCAQ